ncbi:MAG: hypothetical protein E6H74_15305 [Betaproteobacteria bacterium]|nr:MAG: hypothetical protein E6H74_15305 [Betaproteobacteria bacterium]
MSELLAELEQQARALSPDDRARLAEVLLESLQETPLSEVEDCRRFRVDRSSVRSLNRSA